MTAFVAVTGKTRPANMPLHHAPRTAAGADRAANPMASVVCGGNRTSGHITPKTPVNYLSAS